MGHATHFLDRLSRLSPGHLELAVHLYRTPDLAMALARRFVPEGSERVALSLEDGGEGPYIVLARDGGFVTVLGQGMKPTGLPVVPRARQAEVQAVVEAMRGKKAREVAERFDERRYKDLVYESGHRLSQEAFDELAETSGVLLLDHLKRTMRGWINIDDVRSTLIGRLPRRLATPRGELREDLAAWWRRMHSYQHRAVLAAMEPGLADTLTDGHAADIYKYAPDFLIGLGTFGGLLRGLWFVAQTAPWTLDGLLDELETGKGVHRISRAAYAVAAAASAHLPRRGEIIERLTRLEQGRGPARDTRQALRDLRSRSATLVLQGIRESEGMRVLFDRHVRQVHELVQGRPADGLSHEELVGFACGLPERYWQWMDQLMVPLFASQAVAGLPARALYAPRALQPVTDEWQTDAALAADLLHKEEEKRPEPIRREPRVGRNEPCPCGSGRKYKKCCLAA